MVEWATSSLVSNSLAPHTSTTSLGPGREFFVGLSKWTNHRGAEIVADTFRVRSGGGGGGGAGGGWGRRDLGGEERGGTGGTEEEVAESSMCLGYPRH